MQMNPKKIFKKIRAQRRIFLSLHESMQVLQYYKIPFVRAELAKNAEEAVGFARKIGYPVVLKISSPNIIHKTEVGGYILNLNSEEEVRTAFNKIIGSVKKNAPKAKIQGMLVEKMIERGQDVIIGGKKDPQFGQTIMFGLGGALVEVLEDVSFRVVPLEKKDAEKMIQETKRYKILKGYRGKTYDIKALIDILLKTSRLLEKNQEIKELDINPIIVLPKGAFAVDARIAIG